MKRKKEMKNNFDFVPEKWRENKKRFSIGLFIEWLSPYLRV